MAGVVAVTATDVLAAVPVTGAAPAGLTRTVVAAPPAARVVRTGPVTVARVARAAPNDPRTIPVTSERRIVRTRSALRTSTRT